MERASKFLSKFNVLPVTKFEGDNPYFRQPREVGYFSLDIDREFHDDNSKLRFYTPPDLEQVEFDLSVGYGTFIRRNEDEKDRLDDLLRWVMRHPEKFQLSTSDSKKNDKSLHTDFVTWRGHLTKILCTPYENKEPWQMAISLLNGTIYMSEVETNEARQKRMTQTTRQDEMCYWGYKFEDYVTTPIKQETIKKENDHPINNKEAFCSVVRSRLDKHSLVYGAEVDCCIKHHSKSNRSPPFNYIELKTSRHIDNDRMNYSFERYKLLKWWSQSFLAGVPKIVCGFRNDNGIVKKLTTFQTLDIPRNIIGKTNMWSGGVCLNFCNQLLNWVTSVVKDEQVVYMLHWREPFTHIEMEISTNPKDIFLPNWYTQR